MKNIFKLGMLLCILATTYVSILADTYASQIFPSASDIASYDQVFPTVKLRHGYSYNFHDTFNAGSRDVKLTNFEVELFEQGNYNNASGPSFGPSSEVQNTGTEISAFTSKRILTSIGSYSIAKVPVSRQSDNLSILYTVYFQQKNNDGSYRPEEGHTEYQPYTITWCGDGVRDNYIDTYGGFGVHETCDPNDSSRVGWGTGGCSNSCEPIIAPEPAQCTNASVSPRSGTAPLTSNISCSGQNNSTFKIQVLNSGGGVVRTFNSRTASYNFANAGNYTVKCFVDDTITSPACTKSVTVNPAPPEPSCDGLTVSPNSGNPGLTSSFNCSGTSADTYKVLIKKDGSTVRTFNTNIGSYTFNTVGDYEVQCLVNNTVTSSACRKTVNIEPVPVLDYDLALTKTLVGSQTTFRQGDEVAFDIVVTNQGEIAGNHAEVTDYIPNGLTLIGTHWTQVGNRAVRDLGYVPVGGTREVQIRFLVTGDVTGSIRNFAEISSDSGDDCDSTPDSINGNQTGETSATGMDDNNIGNGCNPGGDEDDHDFADITVEETFVPVYDLALRKSLVSSGELVRGGEVTFNIRVFNQGNVDSGSVEVTDYIPTGLILNDSSWNLVGGNAVRTINNIAPGGSRTLTITFTIADNAPNNITNIAEISDDSGEDCDSVPNAGAGNDGVATDNDTGVQCEPGGDEDDHDPETIPIGDGARYDLALTKVLGSSGPFVRGGNVTFNIILENQGDIDANYIQVTDYIPTGLILSDTNWSQVGNNAVRTIYSLRAGQSRTFPITFIIADDAPDSITNIAEISNDDGEDCDSTPNAGPNNDGTPVDNDTGVQCEPGGDEDDHDPETIPIGDVEIYDLALRKLLDSVGPFIRGEDVTFKITVENQGNVDSGAVEVTDYIPTGLILNDSSWNLVGGNAVRTINNIAPGGSRTLTITFTIADDAPDSITNIAEISDDSGEDCDSTMDSNSGNDGTPVDNDTGMSCEPGGDEDDSDPETIPVGDANIYDLALRKTLTSGQDQPFVIGGDVTFDITVFNQGNVDSGAVEVTDYIPTGLILNDSAWNQVGGNAVRTINNIAAGASRTLTITFTIADDAPNNITNIAEITDDSGEDCDSTPDNDGTNDTTVDNEIGSGCDNPPVDVCDTVGGGTIPDSCDEDDQDPEVIVVVDPDAYDLALRKTVSGNPELTPGSLVTFNITVFNQGNVDSGEVEVTDYIPVGLTLTDNTWSQSGNLATRIISNIPAGGSETLTITFTIQSSIASGTTITNFAEISDDSGDDCDSIADNDVENDGNADDDNIGTGCNPGGDKDDHDPETIVITIPTTPSINIVKTDANPLDQDGIVGNDSQLINSGDSSEFQITVTNDGTEDLRNIVVSDALAPQCAGSVELPGTYPSSWNSFTTDATSNVLKPGESFSYTCERANTVSDYTNTAGVTAVGVDSNDSVSDTDTSVVDIRTGGSSSSSGGGSSSSSSGGGSTYQCVGASQSGSTVTCLGNSQVESFYLKCGANVLSPKNATVFNGAQTKAEFNCSDSVFQCYVYDRDNTPVQGAAWRTSAACLIQDSGNGGGGGSPSCGNGIIETSKGEQCDQGSNNRGSADPDASAYCNNSCQVVVNTTSCAVTGTCLSTWPNQGDMIFNIDTETIIGHTSSALIGDGDFYLRNESDYDVRYEELCMKVTANSSALTSDGGQAKEYCANLNNEVIYAYETVRFSDYDSRTPEYLGNKNAIPAGQDFLDATITPTVQYQGNKYYTAYFSTDSEKVVRVAKPAVATVGGGTTFVADSTLTGDIYKTTDGVGTSSNANTNFVGVAATGTGNAISSSSEVVTQVEVIENIEEEEEEYTQSVEVVTSNTSTPAASIPAVRTDFTDTSAAERFNGLDNVIIVRDRHVRIADMSDLPLINESTTFIVDGGNLEINGDIVSDKNIAFVVRGGGDIIIGADVENLDGTYISTDGEIRSFESGKQLTVNGSLYGDLTNLVANRYYVSQDTTSGQLSVGTVVSFGSQIFTKPAPLVSQFIGEYLESEKVAR